MKFGASRDGRSQSGDITGFLGEGMEIEGQIRFKDTLRVDGRVKATVRGEGELVIGPTGQVEGEVTVVSVSVSGRLKGTVRVKERLEVHGGGRVEGEVLLGKPGLVIHDGGIVEAKIQMGTVNDPAGALTSTTKVGEGRAAAVKGTV